MTISEQSFNIKLVNKSAQAGLALTALLLIVAGVVIVALLKDRINLNPNIIPSPPTESTSSAAPATSTPLSPSPSPVTTASPVTSSNPTSSPTSTSDQTTSNPSSSPTSSPSPSQTKLPFPTIIPTIIPIPTEKNLVSLSNSFGASSSYGTAYGPYWAFDGSTSTRWSAAKDQAYGQVWLEWSSTKTVTSFGWISLDNKYGAPKNFEVRCGSSLPAFGSPATYSKLVGNYSSSSWSVTGMKDPSNGKPVSAQWCGLKITDTQDKTYAATVTEIQVKGY